MTVIFLCISFIKLSVLFIMSDSSQLDFNKLQDFLKFFELKRWQLSLWKSKFKEYTFSELSNYHAEIPFSLQNHGEQLNIKIWTLKTKVMTFKKTSDLLQNKCLLNSGSISYCYDCHGGILDSIVSILTRLLTGWPRRGKRFFSSP